MSGVVTLVEPGFKLYLHRDPAEIVANTTVFTNVNVVAVPDAPGMFLIYRDGDEEGIIAHGSRIIVAPS